LKPGSFQVAADIASRALLALGATNLMAKLGAFVASYGGHAWHTDAKIQTSPDVKRFDGRPYHRESIGRARRLMAARGWLGSRRIFAQQALPNGMRSSQGTTDKTIAWKVLGVKNPMTRGERRERKQQQGKAQRVELAPLPKRRVALEPSFVALVAGIGSMPVPATRARPRAVERPVDRARDEQTTLEERAADARRRFAEWAAVHPDGRGPP